MNLDDEKLNQAIHDLKRMRWEAQRTVAKFTQAIDEILDAIQDNGKRSESNRAE